MNNAFNSFVWGGFECTSARTHKRRMDMLRETYHDELVVEDYKELKKYGIHTAREGLSWNRIDKGHSIYDFSFYDPILRAGVQEDIQQVWDLNHFDYPEWTNPMSVDFIQAYTAYGIRAIDYLRKFMHDDLYIVAMNEISFFSWIGADKGYWAPFQTGSKNGFKMKQILVQSVISLINAVKKNDKHVHFIHVDPFMWRLTKNESDTLARDHVQYFNEIIRYEAWDMLMGIAHPELGGDPSYVDYIGVNYYLHNQEYVSSTKRGKLRHATIPFYNPDRIRFGSMIRELYDRYRKPLIVTETGSYGYRRLRWWKRILAEITECLHLSIPVEGICAYPVLDRLNSSDFLIPKSGLWDFDHPNQSYKRHPHYKTLQLIRDYQRDLDIVKK